MKISLNKAKASLGCAGHKNHYHKDYYDDGYCPKDHCPKDHYPKEHYDSGCDDYKKKDCSRDFDKTIPEYIRLAETYTPYQRYSQECLFSPEEGFTKGTIFKGLFRKPPLY